MTMSNLRAPPLSSMWRIIAALIVSTVCVVGARTDDRSVIIVNKSGVTVSMSWVDSINTGDKVLTLDPDIIPPDASHQMNSYVSHEFNLQEIPPEGSESCAEGACRTLHFAIKETDRQVIDINPGFTLFHNDHKTNAMNEAKRALEDCKQWAREDLDGDLDVEQVMNQFEGCMIERSAHEIVSSAEEISFYAHVRETMAERYETYTCMDFDLPTSTPFETYHWRDLRHKRKRSMDVSVLFDRPSAKIHVIQNFISPEECEAIDEIGRPHLIDATVADDSGGDMKSEARKAKQADVPVPWEDDDNAVTIVSKRIYDYVEEALGLDHISEAGQEDLMSIQYKSPKVNGTQLKAYKEYDQYLPHCDGQCTGEPHKKGGRIATMIMYCKVPERGGATNFRNAGLHINAEVGSAVFFSYYDHDTGLMDNRFTEHSGCPCVEGDKSIVTQWVRLGVTEEVPWSAYDSLGILKTEEGDDLDEL